MGGSTVLDMFRRVLAVAMLAFAVFGLLPLVPSAFGFKTATVTNDSTGTFFPTANLGTNKFIQCGQATYGGTAWIMRRGSVRTGSLFQCRNNWNSAVDVSIVLAPAQGNLRIASVTSPVTNIAAGATVCLTATVTPNGSTRAAGPVVYRATATASDLSAQFDFTGSVQLTVANNTPTPCT